MIRPQPMTLPLCRIQTVNKALASALAVICSSSRSQPTASRKARYSSTVGMHSTTWYSSCCCKAFLLFLGVERACSTQPMLHAPILYLCRKQRLFFCEVDSILLLAHKSVFVP